MTRQVFPEEGFRLTYRVNGAALNAAIGETVVFYANAAGTVLADLRVYDGTGTPGAVIPGASLTVDQHSLVPLFWGPDEVGVLWAKASGGPLTQVYARFDDRMSAAQTNLALAGTALQPSEYGVVPDELNLGMFNLVNSGAIGSTVLTDSGTQNLDHTELIQAYINEVSAAAKAVSSFGVATIECPPLHYRVQNVVLPGNVRLRGNGTVFRYVSNAGVLNPPQGPGNYVFRLSGSYNRLENLVICGALTGSWTGGVWLGTYGSVGIGSPRSFQNFVTGCTFDRHGGRHIFDQGVGNHVDNNFGQNGLLSATNIGHFMGAAEFCGTDGFASHNEFGPSVVATSNGIAVPRCPTRYDATSFGSTNGVITLPLVNGTITFTTAPASTTGGVLIIDGHVITYTGVSGVTATGAYCADTGTIASGIPAYDAVGFVAGFAVGGANNMSNDNVCEFGDVSIFAGNSTKAHVRTGLTLTTSGQTLHLDNTSHLLVTAHTVSTPVMTGTTLSTPAIAYTSISEATTATQVTLSSTPVSVLLSSTAGWPTSGTFIVNGYTVAYTGITANNLNGCTIISGSATIPSGSYARSNALNGASVTSGTLVLAANAAITEYGGGTHTRMSNNRADFSRTHGIVLAGGGGSMVNTGAIMGAVTATNTYDAFHVVSGSGSNWDATGPWEYTSSGLNRFRSLILDVNGGTVNQNRWIHPRSQSAHRKVGVFGGTAGAWITLARGPGLPLTANSATPSVDGLSDVITANTAPTTITNFTLGVIGQKLTVLQDANTTIANNATIVTSSGADIAPPASGYRALEFQMIGYGNTPTTAWYQLGGGSGTATESFGIRPQSGYYVGPAGYRSVMATVANSEYAFPMYFAKAGLITTLGIEVTAAGTAGTVIRLGIRADNGGAAPGALLLDAGTLAGDAITAGIEKTGLSFAVAPGLYWFTATVQSAGATLPTLRAQLADTWPAAATSLTSALSASSLTGYISSGSTVTGALPNAYPAHSRSGLVPRVVAKCG